MINLTTFESNNLYYIRYKLNGLTYQKRISFDHFCDIEESLKRNELITK